MGITFLCACGCTHPSEALVKVNTGQARGTRKRCPEHRNSLKGNIKQRFNTCIICKQTFPVALSGRAKIKCDHCENIKIPVKEITLNCAQTLKDKGLKVIPGHVINFYECGCIVPNMFDTNKLEYFTKTNSRSRTCPFHKKPSALLAKYKVCGTCGNSQTGWAIQSSKTCMLCPTVVKNNKKHKKRTLNNAEFADPDRWDCSRREICFKHYIKHAAIPCKKCGGYNPVSLEIDIFNTVHDDASVYNNYIYL